jgi:hypothetical protein
MLRSGVGYDAGDGYGGAGCDAHRVCVGCDSGCYSYIGSKVEVTRMVDVVI